jgi:hypothetical protein
MTAHVLVQKEYAGKDTDKKVTESEGTIEPVSFLVE